MDTFRVRLRHRPSFRIGRNEWRVPVESTLTTHVPHYDLFTTQPLSPRIDEVLTGLSLLPREEIEAGIMLLADSSWGSRRDADGHLKRARILSALIVLPNDPQVLALDNEDIWAIVAEVEDTRRRFPNLSDDEVAATVADLLDGVTTKPATVDAIQAIACRIGG